MNNHREFLYRFSKILGTSESEKRLSIEIFIKFISQKLEVGDELRIDSLGYFAYKKVKPISSENTAYQKVILFSKEKIADSNTNVLLFFLPEETLLDVPVIDSYLNLSFGQPIITSEQDVDIDISQSASNNEMIALIESKVERLISEATIYPHSEATAQEYFMPVKEEEILFDPSNQEELSSDITEEEMEEKLQESEVSEADEFIEKNDDFDIVEPDKKESLNLLSDDKQDEDKGVFDILPGEERDDLPEQNGSESTIDGYSQVKDPFLKSVLSNSSSGIDISENSMIESSGSERSKRIKRKLVPILFGLLIIVTSAVGVYLNYDKLKGLIISEQIQSPEAELKKSIDPIIINRSLEFPVTYPRKRNEPMKAQTPDSLIISSSVFAAKLISNEIVLDEGQQPPVKVDQLDVEMVKVKGNIYQRGAEFLVQVSSWKSKSVAEKELRKYIENGYSAELVEESSSNIGRYRKVMVGGFNSFDEANNFLNQNK